MSFNVGCSHFFCSYTDSSFPRTQVALATYLAKWNPRDAPKPIDRCAPLPIAAQEQTLTMRDDGALQVGRPDPHTCACPPGTLARSEIGLIWYL